LPTSSGSKSKLSNQQAELVTRAEKDILDKRRLPVFLFETEDGGITALYCITFAQGIQKCSVNASYTSYARLLLHQSHAHFGLYVRTDGQSASLSGCPAPILFVTDERTGLSFTLLLVLVPWD
jgi:hypothetical protein